MALILPPQVYAMPELKAEKVLSHHNRATTLFVHNAVVVPGVHAWPAVWTTKQ